MIKHSLSRSEIANIVNYSKAHEISIESCIKECGGQYDNATHIRNPHHPDYWGIVKFETEALRTWFILRWS
jgi:hypothetical protein